MWRGYFKELEKYLIKLPFYCDRSLQMSNELLKLVYFNFFNHDFISLDRNVIIIYI